MRALALAVPLLAVAIDACSAGQGDVASRSNASCGACHTAIAAQFARSRHAAADSSRVFQALRATVPPRTAAFCDGCHVPHRSGDERGVGCVTCHAAIGNEETKNGRLVASDEPVMGGRIADPAATSAHASRARAFTSSSELCGTCHDVVGPGAFVESPFEEWTASPARAEGTSCAACHMSEVPGEPAPRARGSVAEGGPTREVPHHGFAGVDSEDAARLLARAASVRIEAIDARAAEADVTVRITNRNRGHSLPSGARAVREVWLELSTIDAQGNVRGITPDTGEVDLAGRVELGDLLTDHGVRTANALIADHREVRAIDAAGSRTAVATVPLVSGGARVIKVRARLLFRPFARALVRRLGLDEASLDNPVTVLAEAVAPVP